VSTSDSASPPTRALAMAEARSSVYPGVMMGAMSAAALSRATHAEDDLSAKLRDAELEASYRSAKHLGFDELIDPRETRDALLAGLQRGLSSRQAARSPVSRTVILP
jgi:acetyl-CoA carboxylase carboxyltransferase component